MFHLIVNGRDLVLICKGAGTTPRCHRGCGLTAAGRMEGLIATAAPFYSVT